MTLSKYLLSPFAAAGSLWISSDTGTVPVFSILLSSCSCSSSANSASKSDSSTASPIGALVIALAISSPNACCSRSFSLIWQLVTSHQIQSPGMQYIVSSTLSMLSLPCMCAIALPAFSIAARVSLLIFAASIEYICCSSVDICADVCSRVCSCCFFRFKAALAAVYQTVSKGSNTSNPVRI